MGICRQKAQCNPKESWDSTPILHGFRHFKRIGRPGHSRFMGRGMPAFWNFKHVIAGACRLLRGLLVLGLLLLLLASVAPFADRWYQGWLARSMAARIMQTDGIQVRIAIRQMAALGLPAIDPLVELAASPHTTPALSAQQVIDNLLATWKIEVRHDSNRHKFSKRLEVLIAALAVHVNKLGPAGKTWAEQLALEVLLQSEQASPRQTARMLADCQRVLAAVPPRGPRLRNTTQAIGRPEPPHPRPVYSPSDMTVLAMTNQGSDVPLKSIRPSRPAGVPPTGKKPDNDSFRPVQSPALNPSDHSPWSPQWDTPPEVKKASEVKKRSGAFCRNGPDQPLRSVPGASQIRLLTPFSPPLGLHPVVDVPSPDAMAAMRRKYRLMASRELVILLANSRGYQAKMIRDVAHNRGISDVELALAQRLAAPEATMRRELLEDLSSLPAVSARRWLHWLLEDSDAQVRLGALTRMATSGDPQLYELARNRAIQDSDPRVAALAARIVKAK